jgi:hypothetical protein
MTAGASQKPLALLLVETCRYPFLQSLCSIADGNNKTFYGTLVYQKT